MQYNLATAHAIRGEYDKASANLGEVISATDNKYLSWVYGVDRKICHESHCLASRGLPSDA